MKLSQKIKRGNLECFRKKTVIVGTVLWGYKVINKKYAVNESEAKIIRYIFQLYADGHTFVSIAKHLIECGITRRGKYLCDAELSVITRNKKYIGIYEHNGVSYPNRFSPLMGKELFYKVQAKRKGHLSTTLRNVENPLLLFGRAYYGYCGARLVTYETTFIEGTHIRHKFYKCNTCRHQGNAKCPLTIKKKEPLEKLVLDSTKKMLFEKNYEILCQRAYEQIQKEKKETRLI